VSRWPAYAVVLALAFLGGRLSKRPEARVETRTVEKEVVRWAKSEQTVASTSASAAKQENVRVVTKWLRPDGTTSREQTRESALLATKATQQSAATSSQVEGSRDSRSVTANAPSYQPRLHVQGLLGLNLGAQLKREWGVAASYRIVGPVTVGAWALPGLRVGGASVGLTF
jgi:hypothetical protein